MYADELYNQIMEGMRGLTRQQRINVAVNSLDDCNIYFQDRGLSRVDARDACMMIFGMIACNDGKISSAEHDLFCEVFGEHISYNEFFDTMSLANKQYNRDKTADRFTSSNDREFMMNYIYACYAIACVDGDVSSREENLILSLCRIVTERFG